MSARFRKIIVPLDGTRSSERALSFAKTLAGTATGELIILRVDGPEAHARRSPGRQAGVRGGVFAGALAVWMEFGANRRLQEDVGRTIASAAARRGADLVAMSTRARSTLGG
jgi:nucleotide-binding universal stress UspA family protein